MIRVRMHRLILGVPDDVFVDHKNRDTLDNRRSNLRACTVCQNNAHTRPSHRSISGFKGVGRYGSSWVARINDGTGLIEIGRFDSAECAAQEYDRVALDLFGEFAYLNFPNIREVA